jgi:hypothetical protein
MQPTRMVPQYSTMLKTRFMLAGCFRSTEESGLGRNSLRPDADSSDYPCQVRVVQERYPENNPKRGNSACAGG